jgi:prepilin-type N-terminal cleavage/methylation domain-containing protein
MAKHALISKLKQRWYSARKHSHASHTKGFTLLELLIVTIIAAGIVAGLLSIVTQLLEADLREASRNDTQREMRLALDFIANEVQEAVYVYDPACLAGATGTSQGQACYGILPYLPASLTSTSNMPVLAFWKQQPLPQVLKNQCSSASPPANVPCLNANSYSLVVYSLNNDNSSNTWRGQARITRYALTQFDQNGAANAGYVDPGQYNNFASWPFAVDSSTGTVINPQSSPPTGAAQVLVDFVDDGAGMDINAAIPGPTLPDPLATDENTLCPNPNAPTTFAYRLSPNLPTGNFASKPRSFYACISSSNSTGANKDVILFVRGNAYRRPAINTVRGFLPTVETRVLSRGVLQRNPDE